METAVELMAEAAYNRWVQGVECAEPSWGRLPSDHRDRLIASMRSAVFALFCSDEAIQEIMQNVARTERERCARLVDACVDALSVEEEESGSDATMLSFASERISTLAMELRKNHELLIFDENAQS